MPTSTPASCRPRLVPPPPQPKSQDLSVVVGIALSGAGSGGDTAWCGVVASLWLAALALPARARPKQPGRDPCVVPKLRSSSPDRWRWRDAPVSADLEKSQISGVGILRGAVQVLRGTVTHGSRSKFDRASVLPCCAAGDMSVASCVVAKGLTQGPAVRSGLARSGKAQLCVGITPIAVPVLASGGLARFA